MHYTFAYKSVNLIVDKTFEKDVITNYIVGV